MTQAQLMQLGISLGVLYGAYYFVKTPVVRAMVLGVAGTIIARQIPYVKTALVM